MTQKLPLFPLNTVLFPGAPLPLHIFEERYRLMIGRCIEQRAPFGVVLLREGVETSTNVAFVPVGTSAQIQEAVRLDDGRYYLVAVGQRRFRIQYLLQRLPYFVASVVYLPEEAGVAAAEGAQQLRALYGRYCAAISAATGARVEDEPLPGDVVELTYWMAHRLQVVNAQKQRWLEADVATRLREMVAALRGELALLPDAGPGPRDTGLAGPASLN
jgi:Lon protease-like protein